MSKVYNKPYYAKRHKQTLYTAQKVLSIIQNIVKDAKVLDLGCGVGTWASVAKSLGASSVQGMDGPWVNEELLEIDSKEFIKLDFNKGLPKLVENYDLIIWLENVEHLPKDVGEKVLDWITARTTFVLFSGAIPGQGGRGHLNEQWQSSWAELFSKKGFKVYDLIRPKIWSDDLIPFWYKQNSIVYVKPNNTPKWFGDITEVTDFSLLDVVHPSKWEKQILKPVGLKKSFSLLLKAICRKVLFRPSQYQ